MRRLVSILVIVLGSMALLGQTYQGKTYGGKTYQGTTYAAGTYYANSVNLPDSSGIGPVWATIASNGAAPILYYEVDYDPDVTNEAVYAELLEGPLHAGGGMAMIWQYGDSTDGTGDGPHTTVATMAEVAWEGDSLRVVIRTWNHPADTFIETHVDTIVLRELTDTIPPTIDVSPTLVVTYNGNGGDIDLDLTGGSYSESVQKAIIATYKSSYPSYGNEDGHWLYKTASIGTDTTTSVSPVGNPTHNIMRAYQTDTMVVAVQAIDLSGNRSVLDTLYNGMISIPIGAVPTPVHDSYGVSSIEYGGDVPLSGTVTKWGQSEIAQLSLGMLSGGPEHNAAGYGGQWLTDARTLGGRNVMAVEHTQLAMSDNPAQSVIQRQWRLFKTLYDAMVIAVHADKWIDVPVFSTMILSRISA